MSFGIIIVLVLAVAFVATSVRILQEYERGVVFRLGRVLGNAKGPGLFILIPLIDRITKISIRTITMDIDPQDVISRDNITLKVNAVLYFRVIDPVKAVVNIENYLYATTQVAQTHLRSLLGEHTLDDLLTNREKLNTRLQESLDQNTDPWGIKVISVEIKNVDLPVDMQRAMGREAEAERERRAKIIAAEGELQAATKLKEAADTISSNSTAIQLRYLQTIKDMSSQTNQMVVFPLPIDLFTAFLKK
jgi:regulator of protease activity HflC (stomatin/prohibitin superfamily)